MSVEKLLVKLEANVSDYVRDMEKANKSNKDTETSSKGLSGMLGKVGGAARAVAVPVAGLAAGVGALGAALAALTLNSAQNRRELDTFARQAKVSATEFQGLAFATKQYGIEADQISDITKDLSDRFGEFSAAGTGAFQDFADVMGLSKEEAIDAANEFANLSGPDAIQAMITQMEDAGVSGERMTFVLESMGSDLSRLKPLFADNGAELARMTQRYEEFSGKLAIDDAQAQDLQKVSESFDLMNVAIGQAGTAISASFAPILDGLINDVIRIVPDATNTIIDFFNSFNAAENIKGQALDRQIERQQEIVDKLTQQEAVGGSLLQQRRGLSRDDLKEQLGEELAIEQERLDTLIAQREEQEKIIKAKEIAQAETRDGGKIGGEDGSAVKTNLEKDDEDKFAKREEELQRVFDLEQEAEEARLERLRLHTLTREELLAENHRKDLIMLQEAIDEGIISEEEAYEKRLEMAKRYNSDIAATKKLDVDLTQGAEKKKEASLEDGLRTARMVGNALFEDNKLVKAGLVVADTAAGIMRSIATYGLPQAAPFVAATAALGLAQLANIQSATKGGGTVSGGGAGGASIVNQPEDFAPETTDLTIDSNVEGVGTSVNRVSLSVEDSDDFIEELADRINRKRG
jgi:hypothetical protein